MNVMTEEEAKGRACCSGAQRPSENGSCIASACMAWRWGDTDGNHAFVGTPIPRFGYCGLAGRPTP